MDADMSLTQVRADIDKIDSEILQLLARRQKFVEQAGQLKRGQSTDVVVASERVTQVIKDRRAQANELGLDMDVAEKIWRAMIAAFTQLELRVHADES